MSFGLKAAPVTFQRLMNEFLEGLDPNAIQVYMDDIIVFDKLRASEEKSSFFTPGHTVSARGVAASPKGPKGVAPGIVVALQGIKKALVTAPILRYPDFARPFILTTDTSGVALGPLLSLVENDEDRPIAYASRKLTDAETRYPAIERELLGIVCGVQQFRPYIWGRHFNIKTDHKPLVWVDKLRENLARITRWKEQLAAYDYSISHTRGSENVMADCLSRSDPESFALRHLWEWAETRPDLPPTEPGTSEEQEKNSTENKGRTRINSKPRQVVLEGTLVKVRTLTDKGDLDAVAKEYHVGKTNHRGIKETVKHLRRQYYWTTMPKSVARVIARCKPCAEAKYERWPEEAPQMLTETPSEPLEAVEVGVMFWAEQKILTLADRLTKFAFAHLHLLAFFGTVGLPGVLVLVKGREFQNA
ncbi:hypothetical protein AAG570_013019 [Ranatra chinensis]|uniref:RNA-directed DNA polymerase n=1 Tax=Ranatra chinensis TaxID=642074 RepID=A0ABD0Z3U7_9HEMI